MDKGFWAQGTFRQFWHPMLDIENLTPFRHLAYGMMDGQNALFDVVAVKASYTMSRATDAGMPDRTTHTLEPTADQPRLLVKDEPYDGNDAGSVRRESDLAPHKPKCDVIVNAQAHSPNGRPASAVRVRVEVTRSDQLGAHGSEVLIDYAIIVNGERWFVRHDALDRAAAAVVWLFSLSAVRASKWFLTKPTPFTACPIRYEHAYGGALKIYAGDAAAERVHPARKLSDTARAVHPEGEAAPVVHTGCPSNPIGQGYLKNWYVRATAVTRWPAPRIEAKGSSLTPELFEAMMSDRVEVPERSAALMPQGFGVVGRSWQPRLALGGTYDEAWRETRWPYLPAGFDFGYWNGAHPSMQCEPLSGGERVTLTNLASPDLPGLNRNRAGDGVLSFDLPHTGLAMRFGYGGGAIYLPMLIDTLDVDVDAMRVSTVWRLRLPTQNAEAQLIALGPVLDADPALLARVLRPQTRDVGLR